MYPNAFILLIVVVIIVAIILLTMEKRKKPLSSNEIFREGFKKVAKDFKDADSSPAEFKKK